MELPAWRRARVQPVFGAEEFDGGFVIAHGKAGAAAEADAAVGCLEAAGSSEPFGMQTGEKGLEGGFGFLTDFLEGGVFFLVLVDEVKEGAIGTGFEFSEAGGGLAEGGEEVDDFIEIGGCGGQSKWRGGDGSKTGTIGFDFGSFHFMC